MSRTFSFPKNHWNWPVDLTHQHAVRSGEFIFTGGQVDLDCFGNVQHPENLLAQCNSAMNFLCTLLNDLGAEASDLVKLVVYYVGDSADKAQVLTSIAEKIGPNVRPVINMINLPELCYPGMRIEIEGVAMHAQDDISLTRKCFHLDDMPALPTSFSHAVRCHNMIFTGDMSAISPTGEVDEPGDIAAQTQIMMDKLCRVIEVAGSSIKHTLKLNVFFDQEATALDWATPAAIRAGYFDKSGPAATGIPVKSFPVNGQMTQISATAAFNDASEKPQIDYAGPVGHWDWSSPLPYKHGNKCDRIIHVGGQVSLDTAANVIDPNNMVQQTQTAMNNVAKVLAEFNATLEDIVKVTTFFQGKASADDLHENLLIRSKSYPENKGPATTGIPVSNLIYDKMLIEIEVIALISE